MKVYLGPKSVDDIYLPPHSVCLGEGYPRGAQSFFIRMIWVHVSQ